jgi:hypothetical protein
MTEHSGAGNAQRPVRSKPDLYGSETSADLQQRILEKLVLICVGENPIAVAEG